MTLPRPRMIAIAAVAAGIAGSLLAGGLAGAPSDEKARVDRELAETQQRLGEVRGRESVLTSEVEAYSVRIRALEVRIEPLRARAQALAAERDALRARLEVLTTRLTIERTRLARAEDELAHRQVLLAQRLRDLYVSGRPDPILVLVESGSLSAAVDAVEIIERVAERDGDLVDRVRTYAADVRATRNRIAAVRAEVASAEARAEAATAEAESAAAELERRKAGLDKLLSGRRQLLASVRGDREHIEGEARDLQARSAALAEKIRAAQGISTTSGPSGVVSTGAPSASGLVWPVQGPITSGFGLRWGRMHEGIDITGGTGTPIAAAASGTVIIAGWQGGYGQLVVVDHGGGLSTAYAHLSSIAVGVGQSVGQGTIVGGMGTTGNSTGTHLHFEVRVGGGAVNPLGYL